MPVKRLVSVPAFIILFAAFLDASALAQESRGVVPRGQIAVIDSTAFQDEVDEFKVAIADINRQLEPRNKEIQGLAEKIIALENTINTQRLILSAARIAEMTGNLDTMKRDYQRKASDLRDFAAQEQRNAFEPLLERIRKFAGEYAGKRNIVFLVDLGNAVQSRSLVWHNTGIDITKDFIAEYNRAHPKQAAAPK